MPGFTAEQVSSMHAQIVAQIAVSSKAFLDQMQASLKAALDEAFARHLGPLYRQLSTPHSNPPAPQEAQKEEANDEENAEIIAEKQEQQSLHHEEETRPRPLH